MDSVEHCKKSILLVLLVDGTQKYVYEETLHREFGDHWSRNYEIALDELLYKDKILWMIISEGRKQYGVDLDKLDQARALINQEPENQSKTSEIVQPFDESEPKGYTLWRDEIDTDRQRKRSQYRIYREIDHENYIGQIASRSMFKPRNHRMGNLNNPKSKLSRIWTAIQQAVRENERGTFTLQSLQDIDIKAVGNNRQLGKIGLIILREIGWIRIVDRVGVSRIYTIAQDDTNRPPTIDDFIFEPVESIFNDLEDLSDIQPEGDSHLQSKEDRHLADGS